jgi:hypothetical protein
MTRRTAIGIAFAFGVPSFGAETRLELESSKRVRVKRLPSGGIQPQAVVDSAGALHVVYYSDDPRHGNLFYIRSTDGGDTFSKALEVNSQPGSAIAAGTIRGAQIALGKNGRVHVAWNGSSVAEPKGPLNPDSGKPGEPMLYSRLNDAGKAFEPQRNLMHCSFGLDGGGSITADRAGNVYVTWHGTGTDDAKSGAKGEGRRQVWVAKSENNGRSFKGEEKAWQKETGACACCGMKVFASRQGTVYALYRSATESVHRDIYLLTSKDKGKTFDGKLLHKWDINACPMSSMDFAENSKEVVGAWETGGQVYWTPVSSDGREMKEPCAAPGNVKGRKHPRLAINDKGEVLFVWTEGMGWQRGGSLAWQLYDTSGQLTSEKGQIAGVPASSFAVPVVNTDGSFSVIY